MTKEFNKYIGTKEIEARPCTADEAEKILGRKVCRDNADEQGNGYLVQYKDGYTSWSPAKAFEEAYLPIEQRGMLSDGYHTFDELYEFRKMYNAALFNEWAAQGKYAVHKSKRHFDGEECFGGGWFIVVASLPTGQISNHYEMKDWDLFNIRETERALCEFDGHTSKDVVARLSLLCAPRLNSSLTFGDAIEALNKGKKVARAGWNGKGMYLVMQEGSVIRPQDARGGAALAHVESGEADGKGIVILPHIDMKSANGDIVVGWLASQTDMLSEDWMVVD